VWSNRTTRNSLIVALVLSALIIVAGFTLPMYSSSSGDAVAPGDAPATPTFGTGTIVGVNGLSSLLVLALPLLVTICVAVALMRSSQAARITAWTVTGLLAVFTVMALMSIGIFLVPVTIALVIACFSSRPTAQPA
jgi:hypothetical protein